MGLHGGNTSKNKTVKPPSETRRIRKPLMERKRRERINNSLNDLAALLAEANMVKGDGGKTNKLEKADILELTVKHLQKLKEDRGGSPAPRPSTSKEGGSDAGERVSAPGYNSCGAENARRDVLSVNGVTVQDETDRNVPIGSEKRDDANCHTCSLPLKESDRLNVKSETGNSQDDDKVKENRDLSPGSISPPDAGYNDENYLMGFRKCMSAIDSAMKSQGEHSQENLRPKILKHLQCFLKSLDINLKTSSSDLQDKTSAKLSSLENVTSASSKTTDVSSTTPESEVSGLTLVPTRLPGGSLAFVVQGSADATLLLKSAEAMLHSDAQVHSLEAVDKGVEEIFAEKTNENILQIKAHTEETAIANTINVTLVKAENAANMSSKDCKDVSTETSSSSKSVPRPDSHVQHPRTTHTSISKTSTENSENIKGATDSSAENIIPQIAIQVSSTPQPPEFNPLSRYQSPLSTPRTSRGNFSGTGGGRATLSHVPQVPSELTKRKVHTMPPTPPSSTMKYEHQTFSSKLSTPALQFEHRDNRITVTPLRKSGQMIEFPLTPTTPSTSNYGSDCLPNPVTPQLSFTATVSHHKVLSSTLSSQNLHSSPKPLTPPPTPKQLMQPDIANGVAHSSQFALSPPNLPTQGLYSPAFQSQVRPKSSLPNFQYDEEAEANPEQNGNEGAGRMQEYQNNRLVEQRRVNDEDNEVPFDLSLRRMWRPW